MAVPTAFNSTQLQWVTSLAGLLLAGLTLYGLNTRVAAELGADALSEARAVSAAFWLACAVSVALYLHRRRTDARRAWHRYAVERFWHMSVTGIAIVWLFGFRLSEESMFDFLAIALVVVPLAGLGTINPPDLGKPGLLWHWAPAVLPLGVILFLLIHPLGQAWPLVLFAPILMAVALIGRASAQARLDEAYRALEQEQRSKARFLASASHDLDQPLQSARLFFDQARNGDPAARAKLGWTLDMLQAMVRQVTHHLQLDDGAIRATRQPVPLAPLIAQVLDLNEPAAAMAGVELRALPIAGAVMGDPILIERNLNNFVTNALRHGKARRILVGARPRGANIRLYVVDDGRGVAPADIPRLFDDYFQGSDHGDEVRGGYGLGLASVRRMAKLMHGRAGLDPAWRGGAAFFLELERAPSLPSRNEADGGTGAKLPDL